MRISHPKWRLTQKIINSFCTNKRKELTWKEKPHIPHMGIVFVGNIKSGKSTLIGHFLLQTGIIKKEKIENYGRAQRAINRRSDMKYAWASGNNRSNEKENMTTIHLKNIYLNRFKIFSLTLLDTPGNSKYIKNILAGIG